jgi:acetyltransferase-like isoleucine patch superfamily enzyme
MVAAGGFLRSLRLGVLGIIGLLPSFMKRPAYRLLFGYRIARCVRIGLTVLDAREVDLAEGTEIGSFNLILRVGRLETGHRARIGVGNVIRGGERVTLGAYSTVMRFNVINAIPDHDCTTEPVSVLELGDGAIVVSGHRIDFTDRVTIGRNVIIGGRNSSLWTHNRQESAPISIGDFCYLGSEIRVAPGARLASECMLALGSVLAGEIAEPRTMVAGVPAKVVRPLSEADLTRIRRRTRPDIPDGLYDKP